MYKEKMPQCNNTSTECNRKINDDNKKKKKCSRLLPMPSVTYSILMGTSVWPRMLEMCECSSVTAAGCCFQLALVSSDLVANFQTHLCELLQCLVLSGHDPAVRMQLRLILQSVRPSACVPVQTRGEAGYCLRLHRALTVQSQCSLMGTLPCVWYAASLCKSEHVCEGSPGGRQCGSQVIDWKLWQWVAACEQHRSQTDGQISSLESSFFFFYEIFWKLCRFCSVWF